MDNRATVAGLLRNPQSVSKKVSNFYIVSGTVEVVGQCKRKEVGRAENKRRVREEVEISECKKRRGTRKGVLLDISVAPKSACVE